MKIENPVTFRSNVVQKIQTLLFDEFQKQIQLQQTTSLMMVLDPEKMAKNIEIGIFNFSLDQAQRHHIVKKWSNPIFTQIYLDRLRSLYLNLSNPNQTYLIHALCTNQITVQSLAKMTHQEMLPDKWKTLVEQHLKKEQSKRNQQISAMTDAYICRKCGSNQTTYYELQTRSADEQSTLYITCITCSNKWKN